MKAKYLEDKKAPASTRFDAELFIPLDFFDDKVPSTVLSFDLTCMAPTRKEAKVRLRKALQLLIEELGKMEI